MADTPTGGSYYQKWYEANREKLAERRRQRYQMDPQVREKAIQRQRKWRKDHARASTKDSPKFREVNGNLAQVFRISDTAEMAGCSVEFIRKYEQAGVIPRTSVQSAQRYYTSSQVRLIKDFFLVMQELKYNKDAALRDAAVEKHKSLMIENWQGD